MKFNELSIIKPILKSLAEQQYEAPTPIQEQAIPPVLKQRDLLGCAQTGTGKTAAFAIPMIQLLAKEPQGKSNRRIRALVLTPTRELAIQIYDSFRTYGRYTPLKYGVIFGGVPQKPQEDVLARGIDVLVATPGRLLDLIGQKLVDLSNIEIFVLDEADRMLDMGFLNDVKKIVRWIPEKKQTLLFSATMPPEIRDIADNVLRDPISISVTPVSSAVDTVEQSVYFVDKPSKIDLLIHLLKDPALKSVLVFSRTKHGCDKIVKLLTRSKISSAAIHGNKSQGNRQRTLTSFKNRETRVLVATDIAARGIDIDELSHVINYDLPEVPETYVHRIGRTGRAGLEGTAIAFCDINEKPLLRDIEKLMDKSIPVVEEHPFPMQNLTPEKPEPKRVRPQSQKHRTAKSGEQRGARPSQGKGQPRSRGSKQSQGTR